MAITAPSNALLVLLGNPSSLVGLLVGLATLGSLAPQAAVYDAADQAALE